jgi:DNA adenine methylase
MVMTGDRRKPKGAGDIMATTTVTGNGIPPPLKWHGGKHYLAPRIVPLMPPHTCYVEPFAGGLAVLLAKDPEGVAEVANDLNGELVNFWRILRDEAAFAEFRRQAEATPFGEAEWELAGDMLAGGQPPVPRAWAFFVRCRQSLAGRMRGFAPLSASRTRRGMSEQASAWLTAVDGLPAVHARLKRVALLCRPALDVIRELDRPGTLFYMDPPYLRETRTAPDVYQHEMTEADHRQLLDALLAVKGKVMVSGYPSPLYDTALAGWTRHTFHLPNNAAGGKEKGRETEVLWSNFRPEDNER